MTFIKLLPKDLKDFLTSIENRGFSLCLVGGGSRDFLLDRKLSHDLDFELRKKKVSELKKILTEDKVKFDELPYEIIRVSFGDYDLEFSTPRTEIPLHGNMTHHHFMAELSIDIDYSQSFSRRDFTINAIGIELDLQHEVEIIIDPFSGCADLQNKKLKIISPYFFQDSVRFLRLIRFQLVLGFEVESSILAQLSKFNLKELPVYHFKEELSKSKDIYAYLEMFKKYVSASQLTIPESLSYFIKFDVSENVKSNDDLLVDVLLKDEKMAKFINDFFSFPDKKLKNLISFNKSYKNITKVSKEELIELTRTPFLKILDMSFFKDLKNLLENKEWAPYYPKYFLLNFSLHEKMTSTRIDYAEIPKEKRSFYLYYLFLSEIIKHAED